MAAGFVVGLAVEAAPAFEEVGEVAQTAETVGAEEDSAAAPTAAGSQVGSVDLQVADVAGLATVGTAESQTEVTVTEAEPPEVASGELSRLQIPLGTDVDPCFRGGGIGYQGGGFSGNGGPPGMDANGYGGGGGDSLKRDSGGFDDRDPKRMRRY